MVRSLRKLTLQILLILLLVSVGASVRAKEPLDQFSVTYPNSIVALGEKPDFATLAWGNPWDMSDSLDIRQLDSPWGVYPNHFDPYEPCAEGHWCGKVRNDVSNPDVFLLHPGYNGAMHVGRIGHVSPVDAGYYTQLTFRMYIDQVPADDPGLELLWTDGTVADIGGDPVRFGESHFFKTYPGWHVYTIDLSVYENGTPDYTRGEMPWAGEITGLRLDPGLSSMNNRIVKIDWVRLTPPEKHRVGWEIEGNCEIDIELKNTDLRSEGKLKIYQGNNMPVDIFSSQVYHDILISFPPGKWYLSLGCEDQVSLAGPWHVDPLPIFNFTRPSPRYGEDYAVSELRNAWDMSQSTDIYEYSGLTQPDFSNGVMSTSTLDSVPDNTTPCWENPYINFLDDNYWDPPFTTDPGIDTSKYRYFSFRMLVEGTPDVSYGWISRVIWSDLLFDSCGTSNDIPLHSGWNEVVIDLWRSDVLDDCDPCQSSWQASAYRRQLRFDPLEVPVPTTFHLDYIKLTALESKPSGDVFEVRYELMGETDPGLTFYYGPEPNSVNGRHLALEYTSEASNPSNDYSHHVFLPLLMRKYQNWGGQAYLWDLSSVEPGTYYLSVDVDDGYSVTTWYSEAPMIVE